MKNLLRKITTRQKLDWENPRVEAVRRKAPHARGALTFFHKGMGDLLVALPSLQALQAIGPIRIFVADERFKAIFEAHGIPASSLYPFRSLRAWLAILFGRYDYCINFDSMHICSPSRLVMLFANARLNIGYGSGPLPGLIQLAPRESPLGIFMGDVFGNLAKCMGALPMPIQAPVRNSEADWIVLHLGGRPDKTGFNRLWPMEKYVELAERCADLGYRVKLLWGPGDPKPTSRAPVVVQYCSTGESLSQILDQTRLFICNNTGVLWASCLAGVEIISFGVPFYIPRWDPREMLGDRAHMVFGNPGCHCVEFRCEVGNCIHDIPVETLLELVQKIVSKPTATATFES